MGMIYFYSLLRCLFSLAHSSPFFHVITHREDTPQKTGPTVNLVDRFLYPLWLQTRQQRQIVAAIFVLLEQLHN